MLFVTNRIPIQDPIANNSGRKISFNYQNKDASRHLRFCERKNKNNYREIGNQNFFKALKDSPAKKILLYIHGFNNMEPDVFERTRDLQQLSIMLNPI
tara:strand:+ start:313 stop:606 length:294 start_codon:yes stop_codon:yes gene_type:complete